MNYFKLTGVVFSSIDVYDDNEIVFLNETYLIPNGVYVCGFVFCCTRRKLQEENTNYVITKIELITFAISAICNDI